MSVPNGTVATWSKLSPEQVARGRQILRDALLKLDDPRVHTRAATCHEIAVKLHAVADHLEKA